MILVVDYFSSYFVCSFIDLPDCDACRHMYILGSSFWQYSLIYSGLLLSTLAKVWRNVAREYSATDLM